MMNKVVLIFMCGLIIIGCGGKASVEVGLNDEAARGTYGDIVMNVLKVEFPEGGSYSTVWEGYKHVSVGIGDTAFITITENYEDISTGTYQSARITVDSVYYVEEADSVSIIDDSYQFVATTFTPIVFEKNDELLVVVVLRVENWFDLETKQLREGREAFEGAYIKIHY
jgi:hypothetical protein